VLVHRSADRGADSRALLDDVEAALAVESDLGDADACASAHERYVASLIDIGALEAACVDGWNLESDAWDERAQTMHELTIALAAAVLAAWSSRSVDGDAVRAALERVRALTLPDQVRLRVPAGYAYYAVYPETYADAAARFHAEVAPERIVTMGLRSIGTSLSAVVIAALLQRGAKARGVTVRPRGHPGDRVLRLEPSMREALADAEDAWYAIVDEGPISGSSFAAASTALSELGVPNERIVLFPSWVPEASALTSERARERWALHRTFAGNFDDVWVRSGRLSQAFGQGALRDVAGGRWRALTFDDAEKYPAAHPRKEQRKFFLEPADGSQPQLLKFVGLGSLGRPRMELAERLARSGFCAMPTMLRAGFIATPWVDGRPMCIDDKTPGFLCHAARYLAHRGRNERVSADVGVDALLEMMAVNISATLGESATPSEATLARWRAAFDVSAPVRVDGRLMPHEWVCTDTGWTKTDAITHHDDRFLPGSQDIAWDVAGMVEEWSLDASEQERFLATYREESEDDAIERRLSVWRIAYLAAKTGYAADCAETAGECDDRSRHASLQARYAERLRAALSEEVEAQPRAS